MKPSQTAIYSASLLILACNNDDDPPPLEPVPACAGIEGDSDTDDFVSGELFVCSGTRTLRVDVDPAPCIEW